MEKNPIVTFSIKNYGEIKAELYPQVAPNTVNNFVSLINKGFYNGLCFHRVIEGFMIDAAWIYLGTLGNSYPHIYRYMVQDGDRSFAAQHESHKKQVQTVLKVYKRDLED